MQPSTATALMRRFTERTGLLSGTGQSRYLWTDAFAVCNLLELDRSAPDQQAGDLALRLIDAVHGVLGRHREDDARRGWISGLPDDEARCHPCAGGLRIGKPLPERRPHEPPDPQGEWDRDGQYFHYLIRWMHALDQTAWHTRNATYNAWACELAEVAVRRFSHQPAPGAPRRMYWKMSIDLSRPQVRSMGQHDPLDGYLTCLQLRTSAAALAHDREPHDGFLAEPIEALASMVASGRWVTDDALGLGGLMIDAYRLRQIEQRGEGVEPRLLPALLSDAESGLRYLARSADWRSPAEQRLAFRELGLVIGFAAVEALAQALPGDDRRGLKDALAGILAHRPIAQRILVFWLARENQAASTWIGHRDINEVMLATALVPQGYLRLGRASRQRS